MSLSAKKGGAEVVIKAMERNKFRVTVGKDATILDLLYRLSPKFAVNLIGKVCDTKGQTSMLFFKRSSPFEPSIQKASA